MKKHRIITTAIVGSLALFACSASDTKSTTTIVPATSSTSTTSTTTTTVPLVLTTPEPPPSPNAAYKIVKMGTIEIPTLKMTSDIIRGVAIRSFDKGVGWWPGTAKPGGYGNMVLGGHRTSGTKPFRYLDRLKPGDDIVVTTPKGTFTYKVRATEIVDDSALWIIDQKPGFMVTLFACHPVGSTAQRIVVYADLDRA